MTLSTKVGLKGQVVIEKDIRDALGIVPGSVALQRVVGDRVEIQFLPPEHHTSLYGILASQLTRTVSDEALESAIDDAAAAAAIRRYRRSRDG